MPSGSPKGRSLIARMTRRPKLSKNVWALADPSAGRNGSCSRTGERSWSRCRLRPPGSLARSGGSGGVGAVTERICPPCRRQLQGVLGAECPQWVESGHPDACERVSAASSGCSEAPASLARPRLPSIAGPVLHVSASKRYNGRLATISGPSSDLGLRRRVVPDPAGSRRKYRPRPRARERTRSHGREVTRKAIHRKTDRSSAGVADWHPDW